MVDTAWQRYLEIASGLTNVTRKKAETAVKGLVKRGEIAAERTEKAVDDLLTRSEQNRKVLSDLVSQETERNVKRLGLATKKDLDRLERKVDRLASGGSTQKSAKKSAKKSGSATKSAKKTSGASKSGSTKKTSSAKKTSGAKKTAKKDSSAKKAASSPAKKTSPPGSQGGSTSGSGGASPGPSAGGTTGTSGQQGPSGTGAP